MEKIADTFRNPILPVFTRTLPFAGLAKIITWLRPHLNIFRDCLYFTVGIWSIGGRLGMSLTGRRQQHMHFVAETAVEFTPQHPHECAGLVLIQNNDFHYRFLVSQTDQPVICLIKRAAGEDIILVEQPFTAGRFYLKVEGHEQDYSFFAAAEPDQWQLLFGPVDGRILSTPVAGGFVGAYIGLYASSNGHTSSNQADFDWFEYTGSDL